MMYGRTATDYGARCDIPNDTGSGGNFYVVTHVNMVDEAGLAPDHDMMADCGAAGNTHLSHKNAVLTYHHIMGDLHLIINFSATFDAGAAEGPTVHRDVRS